MEGARSRAIGLVAYLGDLASAIVGMQNMLAWGPKDLVMVIEVAWENWLGKHHGWFLDKIRFPSPPNTPYLVAFPD